MIAAWKCWFSLAVFVGITSYANAQNQPLTVPSEQEVAELLRREPFSLETWPAWRQRLLRWISDDSRNPEAAYKAARDFTRSQVDANGELPAALSQDAFAWYVLGRAYLDSSEADHVQAAERAYRRSITLDDKFARAHRNLALALFMEGDAAANPAGAREAAWELRVAARLDPTLKLKAIPAQAALKRKDMAQAERLFNVAFMEEPEESTADGLAVAIISNPDHIGPKASAFAPLIERFPQDGTLACLHAVALAMDGNEKAGVKEFARARTLGVEPKGLLPPDLVSKIEAAARPSPLVLFGWTMLYFVAFYAAVIGTMALCGVLLASFTSGRGAQGLLTDRPVEFVAHGQVVRATGETWLARFYAVALCCGLVLFYLALPFVAAGILAATLGLLWLVFQAGRIPVKLVVLIIVIGLGMVWAVIKSIFAGMGSGSFGIRKSPVDCPKLYAALADVARRVDTRPVDEVYIGPGSEIGVHQEGRGPFGMFGTKRRVLTLGLSAMHCLTVDELKSILAHEYAHFSHQDTFFSRFIYRVDSSIQTALGGMGAAGGKLNYVNPFFWFLYLYYKAYSLLSAGYSRSREFLADRMACSLYGSNVFASALTKVCTEGPFFEMTMYSTVSHLLSEEKAFVNMYEAFGNFQKDDAGAAEQREKIRQDLATEKRSLFASHPTHRERIEAAEDWPKNLRTDDTPALQLFEDPAALECELTEFMTAVIHLSQQQAAAAAAEG